MGGVIIAVIAILGFLLPAMNPIAFLLLLIGAAFNVIVILRKSWKSDYLSYTVLVLVFFLGGCLRNIVDPPTALCRDGSYSYSAHQSGTCSWHGGVARWNPGPWWKKYLR